MVKVVELVLMDGGDRWWWRGGGVEEGEVFGVVYEHFIGKVVEAKGADDGALAVVVVDGNED